MTKLDGLMPRYLRREPSIDPKAPTHRGRFAFDTVAYADPEATQPKARWPWHVKDKPRPGRKASRTVTINCTRWRVVWLPDVIGRDPFANVNCRYGAPMGRHGDAPEQYDGESPLAAMHCGGDGCYDRGGAYWGHSRVWAVYIPGGDFCAYVDATSADRAIRSVKEAVS